MRLAPTPLAFQGRIYFIIGLIAFAFFCLSAGYYKIQILEREHYVKLGEKYRIKKRRIKASRGLIYDRHEKLITQNMPTYNLVLLRDEMEDPWKEAAPNLAEFLEIPLERLQERYAKRSSLLSQPVVLKEDISYEESMRIRRNQLRYPGLAVATAERRYYTFGELFAHVLGFVGVANSKELQAYPNLAMGDIVGKNGIELAYEGELTGEDGERMIVIDNRGVYRSQDVSVQPKPGHDLILSLDLDLQRLAMETLSERTGSVVMMDVHSGEILVYVSSPTFDLNLFSEGISNEEWSELLTRPGDPFLNRPVQGAYAPGSVFKLVTALSALQNQKITPSTTYFCNGEFKFYNRVFRCHKRGGHGHIGLIEAIETSCNVYFYNVARDLGVENLAETAFSLGFGKPTGVDLVGEKQGLVPTPDWKRERLNEIWYPGSTLNMAIGQGNLQTTPLQLLVLMSGIATEGKMPVPHLLHKIRIDGELQPFTTRYQTLDGVPEEYWNVLKQAMWKVVNDSSGTGTLARVKDFDVCGKTGTAQLRSFTSESEHKIDALKNAWFAGFAPLNDPEVAIVVLVEQAGAGGANAAPIAKTLLEAYKKQRAEVDPT